MLGKAVFYYVWTTQLNNNLLDQYVLLLHPHPCLLIYIFVVFFNSFAQEGYCQILGIYTRAFQQLITSPEVEQCYISVYFVIAS